MRPLNGESLREESDLYDLYERCQAARAARESARIVRLAPCSSAMRRLLGVVFIELAGRLMQIKDRDLRLSSVPEARADA